MLMKMLSTLFSKIKKIRTKPKMFVFGDSHARVFNYINSNYERDFNFNVTAIGGATAQGLANPRSKTDALKIFNEKIDLYCKKSDFLFFFLGEVDCGFVIWYRSQKYNESIGIQFERSLKNYEQFLNAIKMKGYRNIFIIETILPTIFDGFEGQIAHERSEVKVSLKKRTELTIKYNERLKEIAAINNFGFVKITKDILDRSTGLIKISLLNKDKTNHHLEESKFASILVKKFKSINAKSKYINGSIFNE